MKVVEVLGAGCADRRATLRLIEEVASAKRVAVRIEKVQETRDIMSYGVLSTPGVVIGGRVVHAGGIPRRELVERWLD